MSQVFLYQDKPYTICFIVDLKTGDLEAMGVTKWNPADKNNPGQGWDPRRGISTAILRAAQDGLACKERKMTGAADTRPDIRKHHTFIEEQLKMVGLIPDDPQPPRRSILDLIDRHAKMDEILCSLGIPNVGPKNSLLKDLGVDLKKEQAAMAAEEERSKQIDAMFRRILYGVNSPEARS